ncbi:hypothetical protein L1887_48846 [Cichorium endivia]|nr:hypothetical protein L1887_48846 [Cichorium endivia]
MPNHTPSLGGGEDHLRPPPASASSFSLRSEADTAGYITASSSRVSHLDAEPFTALPRITIESLSSTPGRRIAHSPSIDSLSTGDTSDAPHMASLSSVTTFVPTSLTSDGSDDEEPKEPKVEEEFVPSYDFGLRDPHERTDDEADGSAEYDATMLGEAQEGDVLTISHSHSTSLATHPHPRVASDSPARSFLPTSLSASWPTLPPSAIKLQRRRRNLLLRLLKTWEGREQVLQLSHSLVLLLHASLDHPVPRSYRAAMLRPAGAVLALSFPKPVRVALMQRIYTTAEGIDNFRRIVLIARWITAATEATMEHWQHRKHARKQSQAELDEKLTGEEPRDKPSDHTNPPTWPTTQPSFDVFDEQHGPPPPASGDGGWTLAQRVRHVWSRVWTLSHVEAAADTVGTIGEACETAAVLCGGGMFWRAVGIQRLGLPFLSRRRRRGVEHIGIVLSLCSVMLSLLALRMERASLRADVRSAHRRITRANDKLGWASDLAGTTIDRNQALSLRKRNPTRSHRPAPQEKELQMLGDLQDASDIDDVSSTSSSDDQPRRRGEPHSSVDSLRRSTERALVRAESDLKTARRNVRINSWLKLANWSEAIFLAYEAAAPHIDKDAVEAWTGVAASTIRLAALWISLRSS